MPADQAASSGSSQSHIEPQLRRSLVSGNGLRCPNCEQVRSVTNEREFKRLDRNEKFAHELNVVYQCVKSTGGCGHIFSPGNPEIIAAFLAGDLVPASVLRKVIERHVPADQIETIDVGR